MSEAHDDGVAEQAARFNLQHAVGSRVRVSRVGGSPRPRLGVTIEPAVFQGRLALVRVKFFVGASQLVGLGRVEVIESRPTVTLDLNDRGEPSFAELRAQARQLSHNLTDRRDGRTRVEWDADWTWRKLRQPGKRRVLRSSHGRSTLNHVGRYQLVLTHVPTGRSFTYTQFACGSGTHEGVEFLQADGNLCPECARRAPDPVTVYTITSARWPAERRRPTTP